jgi:hypothetical protein|tara:strand:+ start:4053 stop:5675 length:1623 start_codon:yes stop_codon:yes gene_type:complete
MSGIVYPNSPDFWDPEAYCSMNKIRAKSGALIPFKLWDHQRILASAVSLCYDQNKWLIHVKPRQEGSSTFFTCIAAQHAMFRTGCRVGLIAHKKETAKSLSEMAVRFHRHLPQSIKPKKSVGLKRTLEFPALDSRMVVASVKDEEPLRGDTVQVLLATEISKWSETAGPDAWASALNAVPGKDGFVIGESTPSYHGDQLHEVCMDAENPHSKWFKVFIPWTMVDEYSVAPPPSWRPDAVVLEYADKHKLNAGQAFWMQTEGLQKCRNNLEKFRAEYPVNELDCWVLAGESVFNSRVLMQMLDRIDRGTGLNVETQEYVEFRAPEEENKYVIFCDPAGSWAKRDMFGVQIMDVENCEQVAEYLGHCEAFKAARNLAKWSKRYNDARIYVESNGVGEAVLSHLLAMGCRNIYHRKAQAMGRNGYSRVPGWYSTAKTKAQAISFLQELIDDESLTLYSTRCIRQLLNYRGQWDKLSRDSVGGHYDLAASMAGAAWAWRIEVGGKWERRKLSEREQTQRNWRRLMNKIDRTSRTDWNSPWGEHK